VSVGLPLFAMRRVLDVSRNSVRIMTW